MTQPCRLCLKLKGTQCQPCLEAQTNPHILRHLSQNWMAEQISKGGPNPLILRNLSQVFSFLHPMKAGVPSEKGARYNPCDVCTHRLTKRGCETIKGRPRPMPMPMPMWCMTCVSLTYKHTGEYEQVTCTYMRREDEGWLFYAPICQIFQTRAT